MSDTKSQSVTNVVGYFNPQKYPILIEISEINLKVELKPGIYIRNRNGEKINDPIFEDYVNPKGLSKAVSKTAVPIVFAPRIVRSTRPAHAVTQASGFVRRDDGQVVPHYKKQPIEVPTDGNANKTPIIGMTVEKARQMGLIGKPKLIPEEYGADETSGAPERADKLPEIRYSTESRPRVNTAAPLRPELTEADEDLSPTEKSRRIALQKTITGAASTGASENFDPSRVSPLPATAPVALRAPAEPTGIVPGVTAPKKVTPKRKVAAVVKKKSTPAPEPEAPVEEHAEVITEAQVEVPAEAAPEETGSEAGSGVIQSMDESPSESTVAETPAEGEPGKHFVCAADGRSFPFRSDLERHVRRKYPQMEKALMAAYPPE